MTPLPIAENTLRKLLLSTAAPLVIGLALAGQAQAQNTPTPDNPAGWTNVTPGTTVGNNSSVTVTGNRAYATWSNFNVIGGIFTVNGQINPSWILVNRVTGTDASLISGTIQANGQVWLINQNGITATGSAVFDVGGLVLSTAQVFDPNLFLTGVTAWDFNDAVADIVMNGTVNATGGVVAFIAPDVAMGGRINEGAGSAEVLLLAARSASLAFSDVDGDLIYELNNVTVTRGADDARVAVGSAAAITADRIVVGAVANGGAGRILISGALNATGARGDGRDIVLTVPDETTGFAGPDADRVIYGAAMPARPTTTTGGTIALNDGATFSTATGGGMEVTAAGNVTFGAITTALDDLDVLATGNFTSGALTVRRDALIAADGAVTTGAVTGGRDVSLVASAVTAGALRGGRDVLVRALTGDVTLASAAAGDDLWIEAAESITAGALSSGSGADGMGVADRPGAGMFGGAVDHIGGGDIVVRAGEDIVVGDATAAGAGADVRVRSATGAATTGAVTAGGDIAVDATVVTTAALSAGRDIGLRAQTGDLTIGAARAGDDIVLRGARITTGALTTDGADDASAGQTGDLLAELDPFTLDGTRSVAGGTDVDVRATDAITTGAVSAGRDARLQTTAEIVAGDVRAVRDVLLDAVEVTAGALSAGRDVAAWARTGALTTGAIVAGDDVVLRAPGRIQVNGGITAGGGADAAGEGDLLATLAPATMFGATRDLTGADVDLSSGEDLFVTGAIATTGTESDVRVNAVDGINLSGASAGRDVSLDGPTIVTGALSAGRDVAAWARTGSLTTGGIAAGDDVVLRAPGAIQVNGGITAGGGADAEGDGDVVATLAPAAMFGTARDLAGADVDLASGAGLAVTGVIAATGAESDVRANAVDGISLGGASAGRDVSLDGPTIATGALSAGRDVAAWARTGSLTTGGIAAGDDVVLRAPGAIQVNGGITAGGGADAEGDGDVVATLAPAAMFGTARDLAGAEVDLASGAGLAVTGVIAATGAESDVRANAVDGISLGGASAGRDVSLDGPTIATGALSAGRDVAAWARTGTLTTGAITAGDDVVLRAPGAIQVNGGITAGGGADAAGDGDVVATLAPAAMFGTARDLTGADVDLASGAGLAVTGVVATTGSESDVRANAVDGISLGGASAGRDVSLDGPTITAGALSAGRDVAAWARTGALTAGAVSAGDDVVLRSPGAIRVNGGITAGSGADAAGDGDLVATLSPATMFGTLNALTGGDVDLSAGADLAVTGAIATTGGDSDVRANAVLGIALGGASAGRDVSLDGQTISTGALSAGRDVAAWARTGGLTTGAITAGDDVVLRAPGAIEVNGGITAGGGADAAGDGDVVATLSPSAMFGTVRDLTGADIDLSSGAGLTVTGAIGAGGADSDLRANAGSGIALGGASAGGDVSLDGTTIAAGALIAGRDVAARARTGGLTTGAIAAGDDVVLRAPGLVQVNGGISAGGGADAAGDGDVLAAQVPSSMFGTVRDLTGGDIDLSAGAALTVTGTAAATGAQSDVRINAVSGIALGGASAGRDVSLDGPTVATGALSAGRDVAVWARTGGLTTGAIAAGDDVVLRAPGAIQVNGGITAGGGADAAGDGDVVATLSPSAMFGTVRDLTGADIDLSSGAGLTVTGAIGAGGADSDLRANAGSAIALGGASAGGDVSLDGTTIAAGALIAGRDVAARARAGGLTLASARAGDDVVLRAGTGGVLVTGELSAGTGVEATGDGDALATLAPSSVFGVLNDVSAGSDIDISARDSVEVRGTTSALGAGSDVRASTDLIVGQAVLMADVRAGRDVSLDGARITGGAVAAGRDVAVRARAGAMALGSVDAGDDVVLRALGGAASVAGGVTTTGIVDMAGVADLLVGLSPAGLFGVTHDLTGADIDVQATGAVTVGGAADAGGAGSDVRLQGTAVTTGNIEADNDVGIDAGSLVAGTLTAGRDVAVRTQGGLRTAGIGAGDDVVLRSGGDLAVTGGIQARGTIEGAGTGQDLFALAPSSLFGLIPDLTGSDIDIASTGSVTVGGAAVATGAASDIRVQGGAVDLAGVSAGRDIAIDATSVAADALASGRDVALRAGSGAITLASVSAGDDIVLRASGAVSVSGNLSTAGTGDEAGSADVLAGLAPAALFGVTPTLAGSGVDIAAGAVTVGGSTTATGPNGDVRVQTTAGTGLGIQMGAITAGRDIGLDGASVTAGVLGAGRDAAVRARSGNLALTSVSATDDIVLRASGAVSVSGNLSTAGTGDEAGSADVLAGLAPAALFGVTPTLAGSGVDIAAGAVTVGGSTTATGPNGDVRVQTTAGTGLGIQMGAITAGRDIGLDGASVTAGVLGAGRDAAVRARSGNLALTSVSAGDDIVLRAAGALVVTGAVASTGVIDEAGTADALRSLTPGTSLIAQTGRASPGSDIDIVGGSLALNGLSTAGAGGDVRLETTGATRGMLQVSGPITANGTGSSVLIHGGDVRLGAVTTRAMRLAGADIALNGAVAVAGDLDVFADTGGMVVLGGPSGTGSFRLDNSEVQRISAGRFSLFASTPLTATTRTMPGNVVVDALELRPSLNSVGVYVNGQRIDVVGPVTGAGGSFTLGSAVPLEGFDWRPSVVRVSGSIGTPAARLGSVSINGNSIFIAPREGASTVGQPDAFEQGVTPITAYLGGPGLVAPGGVQIAADTLTLRAQDRILQRNLQGDLRNLSDGRGFDVGSLVVDRLGTTDISVIDLFGQFRAPNVPVIGGVGAALTVQFGGTGPFRINFVPAAVTTIDGYRLNTCILGAGGGCAVFLAPFSQPPLADPDALGDLADAYAIVDDEPITSSGGEILWPAPGDRAPVDEEDEDEE